MKARFTVVGPLVLLAVAIVSASSPDQYASKSTDGVPTFTKDVAPILYENCAACHRPGEIAPMSLLSYKDARPWAKSIRDEVEDGAMPPWHADPKHGKFLNDRSLSAEEKAT